jgi:hypothetical protein
MIRLATLYIAVFFMNGSSINNGCAPSKKLAKKLVVIYQLMDSNKSFQKTEYHGYLPRFREPQFTSISMLDLHLNDNFCGAQRRSAHAGVTDAF